ncbi:hypothetical protein [Nonomuraea rhodomycinica]|uniref:Peptidase inhibitor family I36 n=1 Tax=Nonomuraea rhodomycinica TaxID=1712872 RepID=A0A7Y6IJQ7_9ACTN|nr:hypothetical protein [Nonomuraea rhodomycinica]NUW39291.1 hypothetical protein [Nonomuraea rhodomycinica]
MTGLRRILPVLVAAILLSLATVPPAQASTTRALADAYPCGPQFWKPGPNVYVQFCPDWAPDDSIPVHANRDQTSPIVGYIYAPGDDWYQCGYTGTQQTAHGATNYWWALTTADNGRIGWVNQIYFRGGGDNEPDATLRICPII